MNWIDSLEKKIGNFYVPKLTQKIIFLKFIVLLAFLWNPDALNALSNPIRNDSYLLSDLFGYLAMPPNFDISNQLSFLFLIFGFLIIFYCGSALENLWGSFKFNLYIFSSLLAFILSSFIFRTIFSFEGRSPIILLGDYISVLLFLAYSIEFRNQEILFFFYHSYEGFIFRGIFGGHSYFRISGYFSFSSIFFFSLFIVFFRIFSFLCS